MSTGGVRHVAIIDLAADCGPDQRRELVESVRELAHLIPGVLSMTAGVVVDADGGEVNRVCLVSDHANLTDLASYLAHPAHRAVAARVGELRESVTGADFLP